MNPYIAFGNQINKVIFDLKYSNTKSNIWDGMDESYKQALAYTSNIESRNVIGSIYELVDIYFDAVQHDFPEVTENYSFQDAESDLNYATGVLLTGSINDLLSNKSFLKRLDHLL